MLYDSRRSGHCLSEWVGVFSELAAPVVAHFPRCRLHSFQTQDAQVLSLDLVVLSASIHHRLSHSLRWAKRTSDPHAHECERIYDALPNCNSSAHAAFLHCEVIKSAHKRCPRLLLFHARRCRRHNWYGRWLGQIGRDANAGFEGAQRRIETTRTNERPLNRLPFRNLANCIFQCIARVERTTACNVWPPSTMFTARTAGMLHCVPDIADSVETQHHDVSVGSYFDSFQLRRCSILFSLRGTLKLKIVGETHPFLCRVRQNDAHFVSEDPSSAVVRQHNSPVIRCWKRNRPKNVPPPPISLICTSLAHGIKCGRIPYVFAIVFRSGSPSIARPNFGLQP